MKRIPLSTAILLLLVITGVPARGSTAWQGTLSDPHFMQNGVVLVYTSGSRSGIPACGSTQPARYALDGTSAAGKLQVAGLLAAYTANKQVIIVGTGDCSAFADSETIFYFYIKG